MDKMNHEPNLILTPHTSLQHAHQPTAHASVYNIRISLQPTHQSTAYASVYGTGISL